jgi:glycosyltransferase involved in cell wall biosynthesis
VLLLGERRDMPELFAASDLVVLPSLSEALPTVLMEAAAMGKPVVATQVGGTPEIVRHELTGLLVSPADPAALAQAVSALLLDPERARSMGEAARTLAVERFGIEHQAARTLALWRRIAPTLRP